MGSDSSGRWDTAVVWFRRDVRVSDNPALSDAVANARKVVPLFVLDPRLLAGPTASPPRAWFLRGSLVALDAELRERGSGLVIAEGQPEDVVHALAEELGAEAVLATRDVRPSATDVTRRCRVPSMPLVEACTSDLGCCWPSPRRC